MKKGILILTLLILALFSVSCIYAADVNDTLVASEDDGIELATAENNLKITENIEENIDEIQSGNDNDEIMVAENELDTLSDNSDNDPANLELIVYAYDVNVTEPVVIDLFTNELFSGELTVVINNGVHKVNIIDGEGTLILDSLPANTYTVLAFYEGDDYFPYDYDEDTFEVHRFVSEIIITPGDAAIFEALEVNITAPSDNLTVTFDGDEVEFTYKDGVASVIIPKEWMDSGNHTIYAVYNGDDTHEVAEESYIVSVKATPRIEVQAYDATYPGSVVVTVKSDVGGVYSVNVGEAFQNVTLIANEGKNVTFTGLDANEGGYVVNVTHDSENYTGFNDTVKVVVHKATPTINVSAVDVTYPSAVVVTVKSDVNGTYIVKVGDKSQNVTLEANVTKNVTFAGLAVNEMGYTVNVTHDSENYTGFNDTVIVKVMKGAVKLTADAVTATYNVNKNLVITLKDSTGKALSGAKVTVNLNGAKTYTTDKNGQVIINVAKLVPKTYTAKITFAGDNSYKASSAEVKVTVKKAKPIIKAKKKTYKATKKVKKFKITLKDNNGKPIKKVKVRLIVQKIKKTSKKKTTKKSKKVKKKNIVKTNKKGKATFKINRHKKGKYLATVKFYGNKYYAKAVKKVKIKMK